MKVLHIFAASALVLGAIAVTDAASASSVGVSRPGTAQWTHRGFIVRNHMNFTPPAANGSGSELSRRDSGMPVNLTMATSGQPLPDVRVSGAENYAAVTRFAARSTGSLVASAAPNGASALD